MDGILLINKPIGLTSRDVVNKLTKKFGTKKIGHTGTLDPFASGVLILTINKGTKISSYIEDLDKEYIAELLLGISTDTLDLEGEIVSKKEVKLPLNKEKILEVISHYIGQIKQVPPMYSALKVNGEPLYKLARRGEVIERKERDIIIHNIDLLSITNERLLINVKCSKGTYIRTLGNDIGNELGYGGHLTMLTRTRVGKYNLDMCKSIEEVTLDDVIPITEALEHLPCKVVYGFLETKVRNGVALFLGEEELLFVKNDKDEPLAIYKKQDDGKHHCLRGLF
ncbi:MAG: tRNA pseudouridine(55) synthase TruB [Erysipelotrichaceae bacterium]|nr:tRNA pseudouridine(55) synthase TruB [Erysipelotrichaceae bacterium]